MWITQRNLRKNVKRMNILKRAGNKINLPFNTENFTAQLTKKCSGYIIITLVSVAQGIEHGPPKEGT